MSQRIGTRLFVSRLSFFTTKEQLKVLFSPFGVVKEASLVVDPKTGRPKGFGFVSYESEIEAEKAMKAMNGRRHLSFMAAAGEVFSQNLTGILEESPSDAGKLQVLAVNDNLIVNGRLIFVEPSNAK